MSESTQSGATNRQQLTIYWRSAMRPCWRRMVQIVSAVNRCSTTTIFAAVSLAGSSVALADGDFWIAHNRSLTMDVGHLNQHYAERDLYGITGDGTLDVERGSLNDSRLGARWQSETWPLLAQLSLRRSNGDSRYRGYLQTGDSFTPYDTVTGNIMTDVALRAGWPLVQGDWQWMPFIEVQRYRWQRNLTQYSETFRHTAAMAGLFMQWRQSANTENAAPWWLEIEGAVGRTHAATIDVSQFNFSQPLGNRQHWQAGATLGHDLSPEWFISLATVARQFSFGASPSQGGLTEPDSRTRQTTVSIGIGRHY